MKANKAPEKIYLQVCGDCPQDDCDNCKFEDLEDNITWCKDRVFPKDIEYIRTDAFIEKALKWYCLDCECNGNCKDIKCFFYREYERYLKGEANAIPPKFSDRIINEDGSVSENYRYRHFINRVQEAFVEKACEWLEENAGDYVVHHWNETMLDTMSLIEDFKKYMEE